LLDTVVAVIHEDDASAGSGAIDVEAPVARRLVPEWMLTLASRVSLFFFTFIFVSAPCSFCWCCILFLLPYSCIGRS
jgi:hypothetical protein